MFLNRTLSTIIYFLSFFGRKGRGEEKGHSLVPSILETVQDCLLSWDDRVWNHFTNTRLAHFKDRALMQNSYKTQWKFSCTEGSCVVLFYMIQPCLYIRPCLVLFYMIQSLLSPSFIIKHVVISQEYFKVRSWKKSMTAQFVCSV